ncbi:LLM class flavin-dependent oxidoreductase [Microbacterium sp. BWT-B31]|uniref:LLM class flavin-dependent oxidoreductase n=1 Tax=Microbacterium sp. BWT-B31 TaxID=3232072 RepID=UPI003527AADA
MTDYGNDLRFGTFVTPSAQNPGHVLDLAVATDRSGLDLVSFQDHPYQPAFLDTSTLLAFVAARTENVHVSANVASLPLRPPAVMARAAASVDILSGGRFELGIGAGAFWDAIVAMGGRRLTPGQGVDALREAIEIIRALWDADERGGVRIEGKYYSAVGAKRGPRPAHEIPVWIGAYKPRMLALTGSVGDGWLPTIEYVPGGLAGMPEMNARIDAAAIESGRDPSDVKRLVNFMRVDFSPATRGLLNGPVEAWIDQMSDMALTHGIDTFLIGGDDVAMTERYAAEVAPAVREVVARERA